MGMTTQKLIVKERRSARRKAQVRFLVDSGAVYSLVPKKILTQLGIRPHREVEFALADGRTISRKVGDAYFEHLGTGGAAPVIFGEEGDEPLLGATTLESLGLVLDPFKRRLLPMRMRLTAARAFETLRNPEGSKSMTLQRIILVASFATAFATFAGVTHAQQKELKVGVIFDYTGAFAAGGSEAAGIGTKIAIDMVNERGGVEGYRINAVYADAQSKTEVAINEATRLLEQEKVNLIMGVYSSAHCVPMAQRVDASKKFMWANVCIASAVFKDKKLSYVFRPQVHSDQFGEASCSFIAESAKEKLGKAAKDLKVAVIYEDGPYGAGVASSNDSGCKKHGMQIVLKEGYAATAPDLSSLVTKLKRARADILMHTGYNPDITLFLRQAREQGLKFKAIIGHGAGYGQIGKLMETFGTDVNYFYNVDPVAAQLLDAKTLKAGLGDLTKEMVKRYQAVKGPNEVPPHASMGFNQSWIFFTDVLPRAIKKHGGVDPEALRKAALETDIPVGGTIQGYGVKFFPPGHAMAGQNERSSMVVMQYVNGRSYIAWPKSMRTTDPLLPFPKGHPYGN